MSFRRILLSLLLCLMTFGCFIYFFVIPATCPGCNVGKAGIHPITPTSTQPTTIQPTIQTPSPTPTSTVIPTAYTPSEELYTVSAGDSLNSIALKYNVNWLDLANYNKISNPNVIYPGQVLKISFDPKSYQNIDPYYKDSVIEVDKNTKHILVVLSEQRLYTYEGETITGNYLISSGVADHPTVIGVFKVWIKLESTTMSGEGYNLPDVLWTMYFYGDYGIHGTYWHNNFGTPMSHGCINMSEDDAKTVFNWAQVGTLVQVIP